MYKRFFFNVVITVDHCNPAPNPQKINFLLDINFSLKIFDKAKGNRW